MSRYGCLSPVSLVVLALCAVDGASAQENTVATDRAALVALYDATDGPNWTARTNWTTEEPLSAWSSVTTNAEGRVTQLILGAKGLNGTLPTSLGDLTALELLNLRSNDLTGAVPSELVDLTHLASLVLNGNRALTGPLPGGLRELTDLNTLQISNTELCAPGDDEFRTWLKTISFGGLICPPAEQSVIDVAIYYPGILRERTGGTEAIEAAIDLMVAETNQVYAASGVNQRISLLVVEEVDYTPTHALKDLVRLKKPADGYLDDIHAVRDHLAVDVVVLLSASRTGVAYRMTAASPGFENLAFAVSALWTPIFAHELGHVMGLEHDRYAACAGGSCPVVAGVPFPYAFGYVNLRAFDPGAAVSARWRTVMAYADRCEDAGADCRSLLRFSNPDQIYPDPGGDPLGQSGLEPTDDADGPADAVRTINRTRGYVANFRRAPDITVSFAADQYTATEGGADAAVTIRLSEAPTRPVFIPLVATGATGGTMYDYEVPATVAFSAQEKEKTFNVKAVDDAADDDGESVRLTVGEPLPAGVADSSVAAMTVTLADNDTATGLPGVVRVQLTSTPGPDGAYAAGDEIEVTVWFDRTMVVTGSPRLALAVGTDSWETPYRSTAGDGLRFVYTVVDGDTATGGFGIAANSLGLNGGTIRDVADTDALLTHAAVATDTGHRVDGVKPLLQSATVGAEVLTLAYGEDLDETSVPEAGGVAGPIQVTVAGEPRQVVGVTVSGRDVGVRLDPQVLHGETVTVSYTPGSFPIRDSVGNAAAPLSDRAVTNDTAIPVYDTDGDGLIGVSTLAQLDAIRHDLNGEGAPTAAGSAAYRAAFPDAFPDADAQLRCGGRGCAGYELLGDLYFDTDGSGDPGAGDEFWNGGAGWAPIGSYLNEFQATFEGNGFRIHNLFIDRPATGEVGLFGVLKQPTSGPKLRRAVVSGVGLTGVDVSGLDNVGGLLGSNRSGAVTASYVTGRVSAIQTVGGLVGHNAGDIHASYANVEVAGETAGGLVGYNFRTVTASYATGRVLVAGSRPGAGSLVGHNNGEVTGSYATALAPPPAAGLVGYAASTSTLASSYWDTGTLGLTTGIGVGQTTASLQAPTGYTGIYAAWNVDLQGDGTRDEPWDFGTSGQYPALKANFDGQGAATWQEFGDQLRAGPVLTAEGGFASSTLTWTAADTGPRTPPPAVSYTVIRVKDKTVETIASGLDAFEYTDADVPEGDYSYQVAAVVNGGEAVRSALEPVTVSPPNRAPQALNSLANLTLKVGGSADVDVSAGFEDQDGDTLTYAVMSSSPTVASVTPSGSPATVTAVSAGMAQITVTATDGDGSKMSATQEFDVLVLNRAPEAVGTLPNRTQRIEDGDLPVPVSGAFRDPDGDALTYRAESSDVSVAAAVASGSTVTVTPKKAGSTAVTVTATDVDGSNRSAAQRFEVTVSNRAPVAVGTLDDLTLRVEDGVEVVDESSAFEDADGDVLTYGATSTAPAVATVSVSGSRVTLTPRAPGLASITVTATDVAGTNTSATLTFQVTVLRPRGVEVSPTTLTITEGESDRYSVVLSSQPSASVEVAIVTNLSGTDVSVDETSLTFTRNNWSVAQEIEVTVAVDADALADTRVILRHTVRGADYGAVTASSVRVTILENGAPTLSVEDARAGEGEGSVAFSVNLGVASGSEVTVDYATSDGAGAGGATAGADYTAAQGTLTFPAGETGARLIVVPVTNDTVDEEEEETLGLSLSNANHAVLAGGGQTLRVTGTIEDDDDPEVEVSFGLSSYRATEGDSVRVMVRLDKGPERLVEIPLTKEHVGGVTADDYSGVPATVAFVSGDTVREIVFAATNDGDDDDGEAVTLRFGALPPRVIGGDLTTLMIEDNDDPEVEVSFGAASYEATEGESVSVTLRLDTKPERRVTIPLARTHHGGATAGDYVGVPSSVSFGSDETEAELSFTAVDDSANDDGEAVTLSFGRLPERVSGRGETTLAILDNDNDNDDVGGGGGGGVGGGGGGGATPPPPPPPPPPPSSPGVSVAAAEAPERAGAMVFDVRLSAASGSPVTVDYATADGAGARGAKAGSDYTATQGTLTFPAGSSARRIRVPVTDDAQDEGGAETFTLTLSNPRNATLAGGGSVLRVTGTIRDDDAGPPTAAFAVAGASCDADLCRAVTGEAVGFVDRSAGTVSSRRWEFGDGTASRSRAPGHSWSSPGFYEVTLWVSDGTTESTASRTFLVEAGEPQGTCAAGAETLCLQDSRYAVTVEWLTAGGESGAGSVVHAGTNDSGLFTFFNRENWEILIKVLDGCALNGHVWVYGASTTDLGYTIRVTDTVTGVAKEYRNEPGLPAPAITDATAFAESCVR